MPPTPLQKSYASFEEEQGAFRSSTWKKVKVLKWTLKSWNLSCAQDETNVDVRRILDEAGDKKSCAIFETFSTDGPSAFLVVRRSPWHKDQKRLNAPWRQNSSAASSGERQWQEGLEGKRVGWTPSERRVLGAVENYLENCVHMKMDIEVLERGP